MVSWHGTRAPILKGLNKIVGYLYIFVYPHLFWLSNESFFPLEANGPKDPVRRCMKIARYTLLASYLLAYAFGRVVLFTSVVFNHIAGFSLKVIGSIIIEFMDFKSVLPDMINSLLLPNRIWEAPKFEAFKSFFFPFWVKGQMYTSF